MAKLAPQSFPLWQGKEATVRSLRAEDAVLFQDFQKLVAGETNFTLQMETRIFAVDAVRANWERAEADPIELRLGAFDGERLIGLLGLHQEVPGHPWLEHCLRFGMMVLKAYWGTGTATRLMEAAEAHARQVGVLRLEATVRSANPRGLKFYERLGFNVEGTRRMAVVIDGDPQDEQYIAKLLK